jgi:hypothetical protein
MTNIDKIHVTTETDQQLEVDVTSYKADAIWILVGKGEHSIKCKLVPSRNQLAYVGSVMGRELIYQRSFKQVREDLQQMGNR